jgi:hypothetical protein
MPGGLPALQMRVEMATVTRLTRLVAAAALLACAGVALGFIAALMRPRPKSRYASADGGGEG